MTDWLRAAMCFLALAILPATQAGAQELAQSGWQCAPFARLASGIQIFGNAGTWWDQAAGRYERGAAPKPGAVLVFKAAGRMRVGHVAVVSQVVNARQIKVTHANWSVINGARGQIENDVDVIDMSEANDWSEVRVWYAPLQGLGTSAHPTYGFIYQDVPAMQLAQAAGITAQPSAVQTVALDAAARPVDPIAALIEATEDAAL